MDTVLVRGEFVIGSPKVPMVDKGLGAKAAKHEHQYMNAVNFKTRRGCAKSWSSNSCSIGL